MRYIMRKLAHWTAAVAAVIVFAFSFAPPSASAVDFFKDVCKGSGSKSAACTNGTEIVGGDGIILKVARMLALVAGITAVIMMMVGGLMMVTSGGDSGKAGTGRKTIVYAAVGLIIISISWSIVAFVATNV